MTTILTEENEKFVKKPQKINNKIVREEEKTMEKKESKGIFVVEN